MAKYTEQMQAIVRRYREAGQPWPATAHDMALWATKNRLWELPQSIAVRQCAEDISKALREEYIRDSNGRRVRRFHAARTRRNGKQMTLWADIETAPRRHMEMAFAQRRQQIVGDCRQLKLDVDSYNDIRPNDEPIQIVFDFTRDLEELELMDDAA